MRPPLQKLGLGTAQFGMDYGLTSTGAAVAEPEVERILALAARSGVAVIDTAAAYGQSEQVLGRALAATKASVQEDARHDFRIVTKLPSMRHATSLDDKLASARGYLERSLRNLGVARLYGLILHDPDDLAGAGGVALAGLLAQWRSEGVVERIGVSVYETGQIDEAMRHEAVSLVQVPVNVFDQRLLTAGRLARLKGRGIEVHARSVLLQGLLLMEPETVPERLAYARPLIARYRATLSAAGVSPLSAALGFVGGIADVDHIVVGVHSARHLAECLQAVEAWSEFPASAFATTNLDVIDPRRWRT